MSPRRSGKPGLGEQLAISATGCYGIVYWQCRWSEVAEFWVYIEGRDIRIC